MQGKTVVKPKLLILKHFLKNSGGKLGPQDIVGQKLKRAPRKKSALALRWIGVAVDRPSHKLHAT
jgi:hypothetical protein